LNDISGFPHYFPNGNRQSLLDFLLQSNVCVWPFVVRIQNKKRFYITGLKRVFHNTFLPDYKSVSEDAKTRRKRPDERSLQIVNEHRPAVFNEVFASDDCMDAGGRAKQDARAEVASTIFFSWR
jgi:hypothetical protein